MRGRRISHSASEALAQLHSPQGSPASQGQGSPAGLWGLLGRMSWACFVRQELRTEGGHLFFP